MSFVPLDQVDAEDSAPQPCLCRWQLFCKRLHHMLEGSNVRGAVTLDGSQIKHKGLLSGLRLLFMLALDPDLNSAWWCSLAVCVKFCKVAWGLKFWPDVSSFLGSNGIGSLCSLWHGTICVRGTMLASCQCFTHGWVKTLPNVAKNVWELAALLWGYTWVTWNVSQFENPGF